MTYNSTSLDKVLVDSATDHDGPKQDDAASNHGLKTPADTSDDDQENKAKQYFDGLIIIHQITSYLIYYINVFKIISERVEGGTS